MTTTCLLAWAAILLLLPVLILLHATESRQQRARRWHQAGVSQREISRRLNVSRHRVKAWVAA
jgi:hypothetical protein